MKQVIAAISGLAIGSALLLAYFLIPSGGVGGGTGTINQLQQWKYDGTYLTQMVTDRVLKFTGLESSGDCLKTNSSGVVTTGACGSGGSGLGTSTPWTAGSVAYVIDRDTLSSVATGTLSESVTGLEFSASRYVLGGSSALSLTSGYNIPLTASTTAWNNFLVTPSTIITAGDHIDWTTNTLNVVTTGDWTGTLDTYNANDLLARANHTGTQLAATISDFVSTVRTSISETITGLTYTSGTGVLSIDAGYNIPLTASTTAWNNFLVTPSSVITAGDGLTWSTNTLNFDGGNTPSGDLGGTWATPSVTDDSHAHTGSTISGIDISADTNLTAGDALTLTDDDIDFDGGTAPGGELGGTWGTPTIDDSVAVSSWNLTTPTLTTSGIFFGDAIDDFTGFGMALSSSDLGLLTTGAADGECLVYESTGPTIDWVACGGGLAFDAIGDATANGAIVMAEYTQSMDWDTNGVTAIAADYLSITSQNDAATDISTQRLLVLENKAASVNAMEVMQRITNSDAVAVVTGLLIDGAGAFTTAIDLSAAAIGTALALGSNDITVGGVTLSSTEMSYLDGVTSAIQTQLAALGAIAGQAWTGTHNFGGATVTGLTYYPAFNYATSTVWTGTTTRALGPAFNAQAFEGMSCFTDTGTVKVQFGDGTNWMTLVTASSTVGKIALSSNNTFTANEKRYVRFGTPASTPKELSCSVKFQDD